MTDDDDKQKLQRFVDACDEMRALIRDFQIPEGVIRRYCSFEVAEFILNDYRL